MLSRRNLSAGLVAATVALLAAVPAGARPADYHAPATHSEPTQPTVRTRVIEIDANGFDWGDAAIGAAAAGGLVLLAAGGFGAAHRARIHPTP